MALSTARAVGHSEIDSGVNPRSKVIKYPLKDLTNKVGGKSGNNIIFIGCDGIFDVASSEQVSQTIQQVSKMPPHKIAEMIVTKAYHAKSGDNLSGLVVNLTSFIQKV